MRYFLVLLLIFDSARAQPLRVAVAANAQFVMEALHQAFEKETGTPLELIVGSSGKLTAQLQHGAPFDVFLSADTRYPEALHRAGLARVPPRVYAYGVLVLWTLATRPPDARLRGLNQPAVNHVALPNPRLAPYGEAAIQALKHYGLYQSLRPKLVFGESIAQVNQYVTSGAATVGFTAKSVVLAPAARGQGTWVEVEARAYQPIAQAAVLLKNARHPAARAFYDFLFSSTARALFLQYGYSMNNEQESDQSLASLFATWRHGF